ncbi:hypothetical protein A1342_03710 [Methylomonas methanica]|uniref:DEAD/DEAH box helicase n=2 Tax=Methylomonas TaxID=416 RepID=A0A126T1G9_9GAMM|nr:hypothetical protein JT25_005410 [Methylomonas denitrificans]OAI02051.1 hypothetical protein A1342_03710 [Methylomonas methanica]
MEALAVLGELSNSDEEFHLQVSILIIALLWSYSPEYNKDQLRQILTPVLSKIGFSPSVFLIDNFFKTERVYSSIGSYYDKLKIVANDLANTIHIGEKEYILTKFQAQLWKTMQESNLLGISAPTSAGKSFLIYLKIVDLILDGASRFVYIVPTLSLISQVTADLSKLLKEFKVYNIDVLNSFEETCENFIYVVTQERALSIFSDKDIGTIDLFVIDEIQNIERVANEGPDRSKVLYDVLKDVKYNHDVSRIILSGPRLKNIANLGFEIFGEISDEEASESPPVLSLTYSISKDKKAYYLNQYSIAFDYPIQIKIANTETIYGIGGSQYNEKFSNYLNSIVEKLNDSINIIFSPTSGQARKSANSYCNAIKINQSAQNENVNNDLADYVRKTVHPCYDLADLLKNGIAYHTGKTPSHIRKSLEIAAREGLLKNIFCTTTLMQGVNLPANNIIIRNPYLYTKKRGAEIHLSAYEFANLRGRAGRLLIDFIGRTVVLDESCFIENSEFQDESRLFDDEYKEIKTGYDKIYQEHRDEIDTALLNDERVAESSSKHLLTHIRYMLYKYGDQGEDRLKDVGLNIDDSILHAARNNISNIKAPRDFILKNRYWDPIDLAYIYGIYIDNANKLPRSVWAANFANKILNWLEIMRDEMPYYFERYIGVFDNRYLYGVAKSAEQWAREKPLQDMLIDRFGTTAYEGIDSDIDAEIEKINSKVGFGLSMLLKPISDIDGDENPIIYSIENGVYSNISKYFVDRGVPRETAIRISKLVPNKYLKQREQAIDLKQVFQNLDYWEKKHVEHLINELDAQH